MFLPTTLEEVIGLGWKSLDIILVSGDTYIDSPYSGVAIIGKTLLKAGYHVGVIAQPNVTDTSDISRLGEPTLFWGVTGGTVDSMVANYTATLRKRRSDDFTPGGLNDRRPDRAVIVYANLIRRAFKGTVPIVLGGIEASLRRITHYDYWTDKLRAPILFDAKADYLLYGMAESSVVELANSLRDKRSPRGIRGLAYLSKEAPKDYLLMPTFEDTIANPDEFTKMFELFYQNNDPITARGIVQKKVDRYYIQNPPAMNLNESNLDEVYSIDWERAQHPYYAQQGDVKALETIQFSIPTHRGCYGECNFCAIAVHEGRTVSSRSEASILTEVEQMTHHPAFKGIIRDIGGPTANMYQIECAKKIHSGACPDKRCIFPEICPVLKINHNSQVNLLQKASAIPGVRKVFVGSGIRYDMVIADHAYGNNYMKELINHHVSGQLKVAPEHTDPFVLQMMGKPSAQSLNKFKQKFDEYSKEAGKDQFLTYYLIAAYPGCSDREMMKLKEYTTNQLHISPEQVQIFTPTPSTYSSVMYYTEKDPFSGKPIFVEKDLKRKVIQKEIITPPDQSKIISPITHFVRQNDGYANIKNNPRKRT